MILAIVGTRHFGNHRMFHYAELVIRNEVVYGGWDKIITGARRAGGEIVVTEGIDRLAWSVCKAEGRDCELFVAETCTWDAPDGYRARNTRLAEAADHLLCIRDPESKTYGSGWTANHFGTLGKGNPWVVEMRG